MSLGRLARFTSEHDLRRFLWLKRTELTTGRLIDRVSLALYVLLKLFLGLCVMERRRWCLMFPLTFGDNRCNIRHPPSEAVAPLLVHGYSLRVVLVVTDASRELPFEL